MNKFVVTIKTMYARVHLTVKADSSAAALIKLADRIPLHGAIVTVSPK